MSKAEYKRQIKYIREALREASEADSAGARARALDEVAAQALVLSNEVQEAA